MKSNKLAIAITVGALSLSTGCANLIDAAQTKPLAEETTSRTTGSFIDDELIEIKALVNISKASEELQQSHIGVTSYNGIVLLTGQVPSAAAQERAEAVVREIRKVRKIHNEITVAGPTSTIVRANDSWLTAKIKSKMLAEKELLSLHIKVVTENGAVYLLGLVTDSQANQAVDVARNTTGAQKVVKMFEYVR